MYIVVKDSKIINAFNENEIDLEKVKELHPDCKVFNKQLGIIAPNAQDLLRVYRSDVVLKPRAIISVNKKHIDADGEEEVTIDVCLKGLQESEVIEQITLDINGAAIPVKINENAGRISIASKVPGLHIISILHPKDVIHLKGGFIAK